jgi:RNA polymerase sigma factor (sigma-70 family)
VELSGAAAPGRMDAEGFERLLTALHPERDRAGEAYERIRRRLVKFFEWRGARFPEDLGDETLDRVMKRLGEGERIRAADPLTYCYGVARNVLREAWERDARHAGPPDAERLADAAPPPADAAESERRLGCLERCLAQVTPETRRLVVTYYQDRGVTRIRRRQALADALGIGANALRLRMHRLRSDLEACVKRCVGEP